MKYAYWFIVAALAGFAIWLISGAVFDYNRRKREVEAMASPAAAVPVQQPKAPAPTKGAPEVKAAGTSPWISSITQNSGLQLTLSSSEKELLVLHRPWIRIGNQTMMVLTEEEFAKLAAAYPVENQDGKMTVTVYGPPAKTP